MKDFKEAYGDEWETVKSETVRNYPGEDILAKVLERRESKFVLDSRIDPEVNAKSTRKSGIISQYVIPLYAKDKSIGSMQVHMGHCEAKPGLACKMLDALGAHLALAISHFRTIDRLNEANNAITEYSRFAITNEVASSMIHQLHHEIDYFDNKIVSELKKPENKQNNIVHKVLTQLQKEMSVWKDKLDKPLNFMRTGDEKKLCSVNAVVKDTLQYWYDHIHSKKCLIKFYPSSEDVYVLIFPFYLREILSCLIVNALQANARALKISVERSEEYCSGVKEECAVLRVFDNGDGIPPSYKTKIFEQGFTTKRKTGTGMGMFITKRLAIAMAGDIVLESGGKSGGTSDTVFKIIIPAEQKE